MRTSILTLIIFTLSFIPATPSIGEEIGGESTTPEESSCLIQIRIDGLDLDQDIKFLGYYGSNFYLVKSEIEIVDDLIRIESKQRYPHGTYFLALTNSDALQILLDDDQRFVLHTELGDLIRAMKITGSPLNELFYDTLKFEKGIQDEINQINKEIEALSDESDTEETELEQRRDGLLEKRRGQIETVARNHPDSLFSKFRLAGQNPSIKEIEATNGPLTEEEKVDRYREQYWDNVDFNDAWLIRTPVFHSKLQTYIKRLTPQTVEAVIASADKITGMVIANKDLFRYVVNYIAVEYKKPTFMGGQAVYVHMVDKYFTEELAYWEKPGTIRELRRKAAEHKPSLLGEPGQDMTAQTPDGGKLSLHSLTAPIIVLYMYSMDCEVCHERTPLFLETYKRWKDKGVDFYAFSINDDVKLWKAYIKQEKLIWNNTIDPEYETRYHDKYFIEHTPGMFVLDAERKIIARDLKPDQLETFLENRLEPKGPEVGGQRSEVSGQEPEDRGQKPEVGGQESEVGGQRTEDRD